MSVVTTSTDRYPGLRPFNIQESHLFFGRKIEINELMNLLISEQVLVLFSKSGVGKSSLLYAGLFPKLHEYNYHPIRIRFQLPPDEIERSDIKNSPLDIVRSALKGLSGTKPIQFDAKDPGIWELMKVIALPEGRTPVLIFDQFEEFFNYTPDQQRALLIQLCELVHTQPPNRILDWLGDIDMKERNAEQMDWARQPPVKIIFAIRDDKLPELESVKKYIPLILKNRFRLLPLSRKNAKEAIIEPGKLNKAEYGFDTPGFSFDEKLLKDIVNKLAGISNGNGTEHEAPHDEEGIIDGSQLQKVCGYIEKKIKDKGFKQDLTVDSTVIPEAEIQAIIDNFYSEQLLTLGAAADKAREIIEEHFVIGGVRTFVSHKLMMELTTGYPNLIAQMLEARLIKEETIHLGPGYELSHDTLIPSVMKSFEEREKQRIEKEKTDAEARLQTELERNKLIEQLRDEAVREKEEAQRFGALAQEEAIKAQFAELAAKDTLNENKRLSKRNTRLVIISAIVMGALLVGALIMWRKSVNAAGANKTLLIDNFESRALIDYSNNKHHSAFIYYKAANDRGSDSAGALIDSLFFADISASYFDTDEQDTTILAYYNNASAAVWRTNSTYPRYLFDIKNIGVTQLSNDGNYILNIKDSMLQVYGAKESGEIDLSQQIDRSLKVAGATFSYVGYCLVWDADLNIHVIKLNKKIHNPILDSLQRDGYIPNEKFSSVRFSNNDRYLCYLDSMKTLFIYDLVTNTYLKPEQKAGRWYLSTAYPYIAIIKKNPDSVIIRRLDDNLEIRVNILPGINVAGTMDPRRNNKKLAFYDNGNVIVFSRSGMPFYQYNYKKNKFTDLARTNLRVRGPYDERGNVFLINSNDSLYVYDLNANSTRYLMRFPRVPEFYGDKVFVPDSATTNYTILSENNFSNTLLRFNSAGNDFVVNKDASRLAWVDNRINTIIEYSFKTNTWDSVKCNIHDITLNGYFGKYLSISTGAGDNKWMVDLKTLKKTGVEKMAYLDSVYKDYNTKNPIPGLKKNK